MKATVFFSNTVRILFSSIIFLAGCGGVSRNSVPAPGTASSAQGTGAFVYVLSITGQNNFAINAFSADSNGELTPLPGPAFAGNIGAIAANRSYLFSTDGINIYSFAIAKNGTLTQVSSINALQSIPVAWVAQLSLDRTGASLYAHLINDSDDDYESFSVNQSTGVLTYLGATGSGLGVSPLSFAGNNVNGYSGSCFHGDTSILSFKRNNDGTLTPVAFSGFTGSPDPAHLCPASVAAGSGNLAVAFGPGGFAGSPPQDFSVLLATYSFDSSGFLATSSTVASMPKSAAGIGGMIAMSPSGKFLAAGGSSGLDVFHFNGADPITPFSGLLMGDETDHMAWDNDNNLYAVSRSANKLSVFRVTATTVTQASGSPYTVTNPVDVVVVPRM
jgi:hypothetical protein